MSGHEHEHGPDCDHDHGMPPDPVRVRWPGASAEDKNGHPGFRKGGLFWTLVLCELAESDDAQDALEELGVDAILAAVPEEAPDDEVEWATPDELAGAAEKLAALLADGDAKVKPIVAVYDDLWAEATDGDDEAPPAAEAFAADLQDLAKIARYAAERGADKVVIEIQRPDEDSLWESLAHEYDGELPDITEADPEDEDESGDDLPSLGDLIFVIRSAARTDDGYRFDAVGRYGETPVGFGVAIRTRDGDDPDAVHDGGARVTLTLPGKPGKNLVTAIAEVYEVDRPGGGAAAKVELAAVSLEGDAGDPFSGVVPLELIHEGKPRFECFLNFDLGDRLVELREKDPKHRAAIVKTLAGA